MYRRSALPSRMRGGIAAAAAHRAAHAPIALAPPPRLAARRIARAHAHAPRTSRAPSSPAWRSISRCRLLFFSWSSFVIKRPPSHLPSPQHVRAINF